MHQLYSFRRCPYAIRTRMTLSYTGIRVELREVLLKNKPAEMLALSQKGTVPVLLIDGGKVLEESRDIIAWSLAKNDHANWLCVEQPELNSAMAMLVDQNDFEFKDSLDRYKYYDRYQEQTQEYYRQRGLEFLEVLNEQLKSSGFLFGDKLSWPDVAIFPFVRQFASVDKNWFDAQTLPFVKTWLKRHLDSELFNSVMYKYRPWEQGEKPVYNLAITM